ncbi:MAG: FtsX-like permease family protein [Bacteroidota bacterium]
MIAQYLSESMLIAFFSLLLALNMVYFFLPQFNLITAKEITLSLSPTVMAALIGITFLTGLFAGSYPAFYLSSFETVNILKGNIKRSLGELWARRGLVVFQFTLSIILIVAVFVVYQQIQYVQTKNLGYQKDNLIRFGTEGKIYEKMDAFLAEAKKLPGIANISSVGHGMIGRQNNTSGLQWEGKDPESRILFENMGSNYDLIETLNVKIKEGRSFSREYGSDSTKIIFNEAAIKVLGFENPIGQTIRLWEEYDLEIIGIVEDFHFQSLHENVKPAFFWLKPENTWIIMARLQAGQESKALSELQKVYETFNPGFAFEFEFLDEEYALQYAAEQRVATLSGYFAGFAILISCLGLFGLAAFTADRKKKEIGIRKVLGASVLNIVTLLTKDFTRLVIAAILLGLPIAWFIVNTWLTRFAYHIDLSAWFFVIAGGLVLLISWLTVSSQAFGAARVNPVECLGEE